MPPAAGRRRQGETGQSLIGLDVRNPQRAQAGVVRRLEEARRSQTPFWGLSDKQRPVRAINCTEWSNFPSILVQAGILLRYACMASHNWTRAQTFGRTNSEPT